MTHVKVIPAESGENSPVQGITLERLRTIVQDCHITFLIGSGASVPFLPTLGDVEYALTELSQRNLDEKEAALVRASLQGYYFKEVIFPNLSLLKMDGASEQTRVTCKKVRTTYEQFLRTIYQLLVNRRSSLLGKQVNFFTTNIDMLFEVSLESLGIDVNDGFIGKLDPRLDLSEFNTLRFRQGIRYGYRSEVPTFNLLKIHGSTAWIEREGEIYFDHGLSLVAEVDRHYRAAANNLLDISEPASVNVDKLVALASGKQLDANGSEFARKYNELRIVNPEKTKFASTVLNETYYELIRRFANELERENTVLFTHGFSFRDEHLCDLVLRAAKTNPTLQIVVFCYSLESKVEIEALLPRDRVKNSNILFVSPHVPEDGKDELKLSLDVVREVLFAPIIETRPAKPDIRMEVAISEDARDKSDHA